MTKAKLMLTASAAVVMLGVAAYAAASPATQRDGPDSNLIVIATDDSEDSAGSAKMGEDSGTQNGDEGVTPENDTQKIDQPPRRDPTTSNDPDEDDDVMPPPEDEDEAAPSDDGEPQDE